MATTKTRTKKAAPKATAKKAPATKTSSGLRKPQIRVLAALAKASEPLTRADIAKKADVDLASLTEYIGSSDKARREKNDKKMGWKSLLTLGYVKATDGDEATTYTITAKGKKAK